MIEAGETADDVGDDQADEIDGAGQGDGGGGGEAATPERLALDRGDVDAVTEGRFFAEGQMIQVGHLHEEQADAGQEKR